MGRKPLVDWDQQPLGEVGDAELAARLGVSKSAVAAQRRQRGVLGAGAGLDAGQRARACGMTLSVAALKACEAMAGECSFTRSEVVRILLVHPGAPAIVRAEAKRLLGGAP